MSDIYEFEVLQHQKSFYSKDVVILFTKQILQIIKTMIPGKIYLIKDFDNIEEKVQKHIIAILLSDCKQQKSFVNVSICGNWKFCVYKNYASDICDKLSGDELFNGELPAANHWNLPSMSFFGLWESLILDTTMKSELLKFAQTSLMYSDCNIDSNYVSLNRVILLHGPPGTGKTSFCKALAHKLSATLSNRYTQSLLVEINSNNLYSKWFSESGKMVTKLFEMLRKLASDSSILLCVLIDEVESLTQSRVDSISRSDPSDSLRVVNAILTQLDLIKQFPNILILTTSNITDAIDLAFVDRADIKQYIGLPSISARYKIYATSIMELASKKIVTLKENILSYEVLEERHFQKDEVTEISLQLLSVAENSSGFSGRGLRKIPLLAHSLYINICPVEIGEFLTALNIAVERQKKENKVFAH